MEEQNTQKSYLSFKLGKETFASNVSKVLNILEMPHITEIPQTPDYMVGVMNLRGTVLPVIDTRKKFGMSDTVITSNTCVLVLEINVDDKNIKLGAMVDAVEEVMEIDEKDINPSPNIGIKYNNDFIHGMVQNNQHFIMILNTNKVFTSSELISIEKIKEELVDTEHQATVE